MYSTSYLRYKNVTSGAIPEEAWKANVLRNGVSEYWVALEKETGKMIAYCDITTNGAGANMNVMKGNPEYLNKHYPFYGLLFVMNNYYLGERGLKYLSDGFRSVTGHSNIQPFLENKFLFRKAYCRINVTYKPMIGAAVALLYPFRKLIPSLKVRNFLNLEAICREKH